ncbi:MAG: AI-2E family transporter [Planctomycetota bacterium]
MGEHETSRNNPTPPAGLSAPVRFLVTAAAFVIVVAGMRAAVDIIVPFLMAVFLAIIGTPALFWLRGKGFSTGVAIVIVSLVILLGGILVGTVLTTSIADFTRDLPQYATKMEKDIKALEEQWNTWLDQQREKLPFDDDEVDNENGEPTTATEEELPDPEELTSVITAIEPPAPEPEEETPSLFKFEAATIIDLTRNLLAQLGSILTDGFMIYLTMVFILLEASILPGKIKAAMENSPETFENLASVSDDVKKYLAIKTAVSLVTGILVVIWLMILGVKYPLVWGLIAFLLNFVPSIGSIIAAIPACALAFVQLGLGSAGLVALGYLVVNVLIGNIIEPRLMGQRLGLSTLVVFLSLIFWGWILGPLGMLLSVPLTMTVKIALQSHPDTRKLAILLGSQKPPTRKNHRRRKRKRRTTNPDESGRIDTNFFE